MKSERRRIWIAGVIGVALLGILLGGVPALLSLWPGGLQETAVLLGPHGLGIPASEAQTSTRCFNSRVNSLGAAGAAITVSTVAVGVVAASKDRCGFILINETANPYRCAPTSGTYTLTPTSTVGAYVPASVYPVFDQAGTSAWSCIRTGASDAILSVIESMP